MFDLRVDHVRLPTGYLPAANDAEVNMRKHAAHSALLAARCRLLAVRSPRPLIAVAVAVAHP